MGGVSGVISDLWMARLWQRLNPKLWRLCWFAQKTLIRRVWLVQGVELRVRGDGKRYKFLIHYRTKWDGTAYSYSFDTVSNSWMSVRIPFAALIPVFRAKQKIRSIDPSNIYSFQLMLSKFEYDGELNPKFRLVALPCRESIKAYGGTTLPRFV